MSAATRPALFLGNGVEDDIGFASHQRSFVDDDGIQLNGHGLWPMLLNDDDEPFWISYESPSLKPRSDLLHFRVAGIKYRDPSVRLSTAGSPGEDLRIVPEPTNPVNEEAHAVYTRDRSHLGYVYDDDLDDVRARLAQGWVAVSAWEWRYDSVERCAMHVLLVPVPCVPGLKAASRMPRLP